MDPLPAPFLALIAAAIARAWMAHEDRARSRAPESPHEWGSGWVHPQSPDALTWFDWFRAIGFVAAIVGIIGMGLAKAIAG